MDKKPIIVIVSSSNTKPKSIIRLLTKSINLIEIDNSLYSWTIDTKYYTTNVNIMTIDDVNDDRMNEFMKNVEAIILLMDSNKSDGLDLLKKWEILEYGCEPDIKLLLTNYCDEQTKITRTNAIEWSIRKGYELIELYPMDKTQDNDIIDEKYGIERVIEALKSHTWSNLVMKDPKTHKSNDDVNSHDNLDDFTELFTQLPAMKESLQSLPTTQRKQSAEQMVKAFWHAIGGDPDEIADI